MSIFRHTPGPPLNQHVQWLWYYVDYQPGHDRQHVLPDGTFELIINLQEEPRKLFDRQDPARYTVFKRGWISGAHDEYLVIDALAESSMIGVHFKPGGAAPFLGAPAGELGSQVVELDAIWGSGASDWRDRLMSAAGAAAKFRLLEQWLLQRLMLAGARAFRTPSIGWAIDNFMREPHLQRIQSVSNDLGISHKHFIDRFRREVGLTPKLFCRIRRFHERLGQIHAKKTVDWADLACACGDFDQAHFVHDFQAFAGLNPTAYFVHLLAGDPHFIRAAS